MAENNPPETERKNISDSDPVELTADQWMRIFDAVPDLIALIDNNHRVMMVNKAMAERLGCAPREATGRFCYEIVHGLAAPPDFCPHSKTISDHKTASVEVEETRLNGIFQCTTTPFFDSRGQLKGSIHIARDITELKSAETISAQHRNELDEINRIGIIAGLTLSMEDTLKLILENVTKAVNASAGMIFLMDPASKDLTWGAAIGLSEEFMNDFKEKPIRMGEGLTGIIAQTSEPIFILENSSFNSRIVRTVIAREGLNSFLGVPIFAENDIIGVMNILTRPPTQLKKQDTHFCSAVGSQLGLIITNAKKHNEQKLIKDALGENEAKLHGYIENAPHGVFVVDRNGRCIEVNPAATRITGYTEAELLSMHIPDILTPESLDAGIAHFHEVLQTGLALGGEMAYRHAGGDIRHFRVSAARVSEDRFIGFAEDITALKRAEAERENLQAQLIQSRKMDAVGRLAGGMAHDFNNMLGTIFANAEAAMEDLDPSDPVFECVKDIESAAKRSADMIRQLLAFARQQTISPKLMDLNHSVGSMLKMLRRLIGEHIQLDWRPGPGLRPVTMDPSQVDQILANLCINARDAISGNGRIIIETDNIAVDEKHCQDRPYLTRGDFVTLSVSDNGAGMDTATREHIFEPFFTTKKIGKGTGLGLATVYGIVKQNAGFIDVDSEPGQGSRFTIYLPVRDVSAADIESEDIEYTRQPMTGWETILLVEDEPMFLDIIRTHLKKSGFTVLAAQTPAAAMREAGFYNGDIHLLITDVMMPEICGPELADNLKKLYPDMKCLFMSGYAEDIIAHQGKMPRDVDFIAKPFSITDLTSKIRAVLGDEK